MSKKRYWLKGGCIGFSIITLVFIKFAFLGITPPYVNIDSNPYFLPAVILLINPLVAMDSIFYNNIGVHLMYSTNRITEGPTVTGQIVIGVIYFILGAFIGYLYWKIKNRKLNS